jgi:hypothetical protein
VLKKLCRRLFAGRIAVVSNAWIQENPARFAGQRREPVGAAMGEKQSADASAILQLVQPRSFEPVATSRREGVEDFGKAVALFLPVKPTSTCL